MPFDKTGLAIHIGDSVVVECCITEIHNTEEYCDVTLMSEERKVGDNATPWVLSSKQITLKKVRE